MFNSLKELHAGIAAGDIDESHLEIVIDGEEVYFYFGDYNEDNEILIDEDINMIDLYKILFPKAVVSKS